MPSARTRKRAWKRIRDAPRWQQGLVAFAIAAVALVTINGIYQVARKPTELFFPVSGVLHKTPHETWRQYGLLFRAHATPVMTAELLAALAQVEGAGNPVARTYWRWQLSRDPFDVYRPASSAVGMYQITDGTFEQARRLCIHDHRVVDDGPWHDWRSCWFNGLYSRVIPSHAIELTAAYLQRQVNTILRRRDLSGIAVTHQQRLAAFIHLCGAGAGHRFAAAAFDVSAVPRCGDHDVAGYLARVDTARREFERISSRASRGR